MGLFLYITLSNISLHHWLLVVRWGLSLLSAKNNSIKYDNSSVILRKKYYMTTIILCCLSCHHYVARLGPAPFCRSNFLRTHEPKAWYSKTKETTTLNIVTHLKASGVWFVTWQVFCEDMKWFLDLVWKDNISQGRNIQPTCTFYF